MACPRESEGFLPATCSTRFGSARGLCLDLFRSHQSDGRIDNDPRDMFFTGIYYYPRDSVVGEMAQSAIGTDNDVLLPTSLAKQTMRSATNSRFCAGHWHLLTSVTS